MWFNQDWPFDRSKYFPTRAHQVHLYYLLPAISPFHHQSWAALAIVQDLPLGQTQRGNPMFLHEVRQNRTLSMSIWWNWGCSFRFSLIFVAIYSFRRTRIFYSGSRRVTFVSERYTFDMLCVKYWIINFVGSVRITVTLSSTNICISNTVGAQPIYSSIVRRNHVRFKCSFTFQIFCA